MQATPWEKKCKRCGHEWLARTVNPRQCPNCRSVKWRYEKVEIPERPTNVVKKFIARE